MISFPVRFIFLILALSTLSFLMIQIQQECPQATLLNSVILKPKLQTVYLITPTYTRTSQIADLTMMANTLRLVPSIVWCVAEDADDISPAVTEVLMRSGVPYQHFANRKPADMKVSSLGKGVFNRRICLDWIKEEGEEDGIFYFADDDNSYDIRVFEEIRKTRGVSVFPVGMISTYGISAPIVRDQKVVGWFDAVYGRKFAVDMAGFAVNVHYYRKTNATFPLHISYLETKFLGDLKVEVNELEVLADNCTKVLVWHTKSGQTRAMKNKDIEKEDWKDTNLPGLYMNSWVME